MDIIQRIPSAVSNSVIIVLGGLLFALLLAVAASMLLGNGHPRLSRAFEHLSDGVIVSAFAVFFWEWGSQAKQMVIVGTKIDQLANLAGVAAIEEGMKTTFQSVETSLLDVHKDLVSQMVKLADLRNWARRADIEFLVAFLNQARGYAKTLAEFRYQLIQNPKSDHLAPIAFENSFDLADQILTEQMNILKTGDTYVTLSNPRTFSKLKRTFLDAGEKAVMRGAQIRRVFILSPAGDLWTNSDIRNLLKHYTFAAQHASENGNHGWYKIQFAKPEVLDYLKVGVNDRHYGIFTHDDHGVGFKVKGDEVSEFFLTNEPPEGNLAKDFNAIWSHLARGGARVSMEGGAESSRFLDAVLEREARYVSGMNTPRLQLVSTIQSWSTRRSLPEFWKRLRETSPTTEGIVQLRHLFVLNPDQTPENARDAIAATNVNDNARPGNGPWEVRWCRVSKDTETLLGEYRCQFLSAEEPVHANYVLSLKCDNQLSDCVIPLELHEPDEYAKKFAECWRDAKPI